MSRGLFTTLPERKIWLFDGGMGSILQAKGLKPGGCPDEFNLTQPDIVRDVHVAYVSAGSDIIQTNTFGANAIRLEMYDLAHRAEEINARAVELAREAAHSGNGRTVWVMGSVGPLGELLEPLGPISRESAVEAFRAQARGLASADALNIETSSSLDEAALAIEAVRSEVDLPLSISMTFMSTPKGQFTMMGETAAQCVTVLQELGVDMIGANCGEGVEPVLEVISQMTVEATVPLLAKPNAGIPVMEGGQERYPEDADSFREKMRQVIDAGASVIGGCCGTTPAHIGQLRQLADSLNQA